MRKYWVNSNLIQTIKQKKNRFGGNVVFKFRFEGKIYEVPKPGVVDAYTGVEFIAAAINMDKRYNGLIYKFIIMYKDHDQDVFPTLFSDFPGIYRKLANPNYANWRDCYYTPQSAQDDTYYSKSIYAIPPEIYKLATAFFNKNKTQIQDTHRSPREIYEL